MPGKVSIRTAKSHDRDAILELVREAFSSDTRDASEELDIVVSTWILDVTPDGLELVALDDGFVVGHVLAAAGDLGGREVLGVAPLAVIPSHQRLGIGTALMTKLLQRIETRSAPLIVLLGLPAFYMRFGFEPSGPLGISYPAVGQGNPHFQVRRFASYDPSYRGTFTYCWEMKDAPDA
jgi:putative acetyltransferase